MKNLGLAAFFAITFAFSLLKAQPCTEFRPPIELPGPSISFLQLINGHAPKAADTYWEGLQKADGKDAATAAKASLAALAKGDAAAAIKLVEPWKWSSEASGAFDSISLREHVPAMEAYGLAKLAEGKPMEAQVQLAAAAGLAPFGMACRIKHEHLVAKYLALYQDEQPMFAHFNGGFHQFWNDSIAWPATGPESADYLMALNVVASIIRLDQKHSASYFEMLGDLLTKEPGKFNANYLSSLAYLRAGQDAGEQFSEAYDRKALFALEAPSFREDRFNVYRFTQLKKALVADLEAAKQLAPLADASKMESGFIQAGFRAEDPGNLSKILEKSKGQIEDRQAEAKRYAGNVDLKKEVKKDTRFNTFAVGLIAVIVGAFFFLVYQVRKTAKAKGR